MLSVLLLLALVVTAPHPGSVDFVPNRYALTPPELERQGLISPAVRAVLERHQATTPLERVEVLDQACNRGELSASECQAIGRGRRRRRRDD